MNLSDLDLSILKVITTNKKHAIDFVSECDNKLFATDAWNFANLISQYVKVYKEVPTLRTLTEKLVKDGIKPEYATEVWKKVEAFQYDEKEYKHDLVALKKRYADRELSQLSDKLQKAKSNGETYDVNKHLSEIQKVVFNIKGLNKTRSYERKTLKASIGEFREEYRAKQLNPEFEAGVKSGYSALDNATGGLQPGELLIIGGESNSGKSMLLMNMAIQMWMQKNTIEMTSNFSSGHNVLYFSLEMPFKPCRNRIYARLSGTPSKRIRGAELNKEESSKLTAALRFINNYPHTFEIVDIPRGATAEQIEMMYEEATAYYKPDVIVIDYLGLMDDTSSEEDDWLKLGLITGKVHELLRVHNLIGLTAVQLNRTKASSKDADERIGMSRIGRSSLVATHANIVIQIETRPNEKSYPDMKYHLIKNREGELKSGLMFKNLACGTLLDDPSKPDDKAGYEYTDVDDISEKADLLDI
jgi:replicative DNA helicase